MRSEFDDFIGKYGFEQFGYIQVGVPARDGIELRKQGLNSRSPLTAYMEENGYGHADVYPQDGFDAAKWFVGAIEEGSGEAARHLTKLRLTLEQKDRLFYRRPARTGMRNRPCSAHITKG